MDFENKWNQLTRRQLLSSLAQVSVIAAGGRGIANHRWAEPDNSLLPLFAPIYNNWEILGRPKGVRHSQKAVDILDDAAQWAKAGYAIHQMAYQIDATWSRDYGNQTADPRKFPQGMRALLDAVKMLGWKYTGLWIEVTYALAGSELSKQHPEWLDKSRTLYPYPNTEFGSRGPAYLLDATHPGYREYIRNQVKMLLVDYGADFLKVDQLRYAPKTLVPEFLKSVYEAKQECKPEAVIEGHLDVFSSGSNAAAPVDARLDRAAMEFMDQVRVYDLPLTESVVADQRYRIDLLYQLAPPRIVIHPDAFEGLERQRYMDDLFREVTFQQVLTSIPAFFQQPFDSAFEDVEADIRDALAFYLENIPSQPYRYLSGERKVVNAPQTVACNCDLPAVSGDAFVNLLKTEQGRYAVGVLEVNRKEFPTEVSFSLSSADNELVIFNFPSLRLRIAPSSASLTVLLRNRLLPRGQDISARVGNVDGSLYIPSEFLRATRVRVNRVEIHLTNSAKG